MLKKRKVKTKKFKKPSEGYFFAKREIQEAIDRRIDAHKLWLKDDKCDLRAMVGIQELEDLRSFVRNGMLWNRDWE